MKRISYSQYNQWVTCPYKWKLNYIDGLSEFTDSIHTMFGTSMHEVLQTYLTVMYNDTVKMADALPLDDMLLHRMKHNYTTIMEKNGGEEFCKQDEMEEFYQHGLLILEWFKKKRSRYFSKKGTYLVGCEVPIVIAPNKMYNNVLYMGYLDVVTYNERSDTFKIIDIKTSTKGWNKFAKKDESKQYQLLLYKQYFSEQYNIPLDKIEIEFFILKRKVLDWDDDKIMSPHQAYRVQTFTPPSGKIKLNRAKNAINDFIKECFNSSGNIKEREYIKSPSKWNCTFCPFKEEQELCGEGIIY